MDTYSLNAYWGARRESVEECARHLLDYLMCLGQWDESCSTWYEKANSLEEALQHKVTLNLASLERLLLSGRQFTDFGRRPIEELGYSVSIWNGRDTEEGDQGGIGMRLDCGCYSRLIPNVCEVKLPYQGPVAARMLQVSRLQELMKCVVRAWNPAWAVVESSLDSKTLQPGLPPKRGWLLYLAQPWETLRALIPQLTVVPCDHYGSFIITTEERFTASNPQHMEMAQRIITTLDQAGLLAAITAVPKGR